LEVFAWSCCSAAPRSAIRSLYRWQWCGQRGHPKRPSETPLEYQPFVEETIPGELASSLTNLYVQLRYCQRVPAQAQLDELFDWWQRYQAEELEWTKAADDGAAAQ